MYFAFVKGSRYNTPCL